MVFLRPEPLNAILEGRQRYETRLFKRTHPASRVRKGDTLLLKKSGGEIIARCKAKRVIKLSNLTPADVDAIADRVSVPGDFDTSYWEGKKDARHAVVITLSSVERVSFPPRLCPRNIMSGWVADFAHGDKATPTRKEHV